MPVSYSSRSWRNWKSGEKIKLIKFALQPFLYYHLYCSSDSWRSFYFWLHIYWLSHIPFNCNVPGLILAVNLCGISYPALSLLTFPVYISTVTIIERQLAAIWVLALVQVVFLIFCNNEDIYHIHFGTTLNFTEIDHVSSNRDKWQHYLHFFK